MEEPEIKITDRRRFSPEGEPLDATEDERPQVSEAAEKLERNIPLPPATFEFLVLSLRGQAKMLFGLYRTSGGDADHAPDLEGARHSIDLLGVLQQKTKGNLSL